MSVIMPFRGPGYCSLPGALQAPFLCLGRQWIEPPLQSTLVSTTVLFQCFYSHLIVYLMARHICVLATQNFSEVSMLDFDSQQPTTTSPLTNFGNSKILILKAKLFQFLCISRLFLSQICKHLN